MYVAIAGEGIWVVYDKRYQPDDTLDRHLGFALRHEPIDLLVLKRILDALPEQDLIDVLQRTLTGAVTWRVWFFYETLSGERLDIDDAPHSHCCRRTRSRSLFHRSPIVFPAPSCAQQSAWYGRVLSDHQACRKAGRISGPRPFA